MDRGKCERGYTCTIQSSYIIPCSLCKVRKVSENAPLSEGNALTDTFSLSGNSRTRERRIDGEGSPRSSIFEKAAGCGGEYMTYMQSVHPAKFSRNELTIAGISYFKSERAPAARYRENCEIFHTDPSFMTEISAVFATCQYKKCR